MDKTKVRAIIASRPGVMQQALRSVLTNLAWLEVTASAGDGLSAFTMIWGEQPDLLVVDSNLLEDEALLLLRQTKQRWPDVRCLILIQTSLQQKRALAAGADAVSQRNSPAKELNQTLEKIRLNLLANRINE